jgi:hypothetical protein
VRAYVGCLAVAATVLLAAVPARGSAQDTTAVSAPGARDTTRADSTRGGFPQIHPVRALLMASAVNVFVNRMDAWVLNLHDPTDGYFGRVTPRSWRANIRQGWVWDGDNFQTNMFLHPNQGAAYFRAGRSNGLNFWESTPLTFLGSLEWEYFGETTYPSLNDLYNTAFGGIVLGEVTWRLAPLVRNNRARGIGRFFRELAAFPLDPSGSVRRLLAGDAWRNYANPRGSYPGAFGWQYQAGVQSEKASDSTELRQGSAAFMAEMSYGDAFVSPYAQPFDVFTVRLRASTSGANIREVRVAGRLYAHELTDSGSTFRHILTVTQKLQYEASTAYKFGGQSIMVGFVSEFAGASGMDVQTALYAEGIMLGAVDAPRAGIAGTLRTYDFGPGVGFDLAAKLRVGGFPILTARWRGAYLHSVSGSPADHFLQFPSLEVAIPLAGSIGIGAYAGLFHRRSTYSNGLPSEQMSDPEWRAYLVWNTHRGRLPPGPEPKW